MWSATEEQDVEVEVEVADAAASGSAAAAVAGVEDRPKWGSTAEFSKP